jgi:adhesin/invasin
LWRVFWPIAVVAGGAITCDAPTNPGRRGMAYIAVAPVFSRDAQGNFTGLAVDQVRITVIRPPSDTLARVTIPFSVDSTSVTAKVPVIVNGTEMLSVIIEMLSGAGPAAQVVFTGTQTVQAVQGDANPPPVASVPVTFVGPGTQIASLQIQPRDSGTLFGATVPFRVTAFDSLSTAVPQFYVSWSTSSTAHTINALGEFDAGTTRGRVWVRVHTPTGVWDSTRITISPVASQLQLISGNQQAGAASTALALPLTVKVIAADGGGVAGVPVAFAATSGGGSVSPAIRATDSLGFATAAATLGAALGSNSFTATVAGLSPVTFTATVTSQPGVPASLAINAGNGQSAPAGTAVATPPSVIVRDGPGSPVAGVNVTFAVASGGGSITGATATTLGTGIATLGSWTLGAAPGSNSLTASVTGLTPVTFTATGSNPNFITLQSNVAVVAGQSTSLGITLSAPAPTGGLTVALASSDTTKLKVTTPTVNIAAGQTIGSATVQGIAAGTASVTATAPGYVGGNTVVTVNGLPTTLILVSGGNQNASPSTQLPQPVVVKVTDALGNPVGGFTVSFAVATGGGSVGTPSTTTLASGLASTTWTLGALTGTQTMTATASGLTGSPLTISANAPVIATTTVSPQLDTITAINATRTLVAQSKDATGANLTGSFTWVSRSPAVATVGVTGVVRAVTNGSTYVVVTEAGGTKDSALIVVQQRLGTINVVPGTRSIYLSRNFTFVATAADGGGTPLPSQPTFTWTSTAPAVATVNSAGLVQAVGLGSAQIRATSGTITGVANISVITPITRIAVVVDTVNAFKTDTFTLTSLGLTRRYRAVAHDTLDAVMTGVSFTWVSTNGSVAVLNNPAGDTSRATSAANGLTQILATAQGFTSAPGAQLTVSQVLASIDLTPLTATIAVTGNIGMVARGKDANSRYISGGTFAFASATPAVATVGASSGVVTGVALGTSNITATSGAITSNTAVVTVSATVPAAISFGRDTLSVGRGGSTSIPIFLSRPHGSALTVNLAVQDTFAFWSQPTVTIPAGQTSINATLNGRNAGTTVISAVDGSGAGFAGDSAVLAVTANMRLTSGSYGILANDIVATQVLLSDPSPAGGTYVTFSYSTPGIAAISPDPAFIPAGQLAADIQIRGLAAGSTNITPNAIGVNGTASSFTAYPPVLYPSTNFIRLGLGQFEPNQYVYTQISTNVPIPVTLTSTDSNVVRPSPLVVTIPGGSNYVYFNVAARATGSATIALSSPGWTAQSAISAVVTTPRLGISGGTSLLTTSPQSNVYVYAEDSVTTAHYRTNSLLVHLRSTDTTVMKVLDSVVTIGAGAYYSSAGRVIPGGTGGAAYIVATASGHGADSTRYTVTGPSLSFSWGTNRIGAGQEDYNLYVYVQNNVTAPLTVTLVNPDSNILGLPTTVTIPANTNYVYFNVRGKTPGSVTLTATAPGYQSVNATYVVTTPRLAISGGYQLNNFSPARSYVIYPTDSVGTAHYRTLPLTITLRSSDTNVVKTDTVATIGAGQYYTYTQPTLTPVGVGTARLVATAAGHGADSTSYTIVTPKLNFSWYSYMVGRRQHRYPTDFYVYTPDARLVPVPVTLTQKRPAVESLTTTVPVIDSASNYRYFSFYGLSNGVDTIIATAAGYVPDTAFVQVSSPRLTSCCLPGSGLTTGAPITMTVYATDSLGTAHYASDTVVVAALSSDSTVIRPTQPFFRILKNDYYALPQPTVTIVGPGTASITYSDSAGSGYGPTTTGTITITGPSLLLSNGSPVLGMRQRSFANYDYVYTQNSVGTALTVNLLSTGTRVATVPATVTIPAGSNYAYFDVTAQDTVGTIQIQATATGYGSAAMNVQVTVPKFVVSTSTQLNTTSAPQVITVYATDANGNGHLTTEDVVVTLLSSSPSVAAIDSSTVTIVNGNYYTQAARWAPGIVGTAQIQASDSRAAQYKYNNGAQGVQVITPSLNYSWGTETLGIGQYIDEYVYTPNAAAAAPITVSLSNIGTPRVSTLVSGSPVSSLTIPTGQNIAYFRILGTSAGTDTLVASATSPLHNPATAYTAVGQGRIDPIGSWPTALAFGDSVQVILYTRDPVQNGRYVSAATVFTPTLTNLEFWTGGANSAKLTTVTVPADQYYVYFWVKATGHGTGSATITATNYVTYNNTVTIP